MVTGIYADLPPEAQAIVRLFVERALNLPQTPELVDEHGLAHADQSLRTLELEMRIDRVERSLSDLWLYRTETEWDERSWENN